jgi:hypothetical protein
MAMQIARVTFLFALKVGELGPPAGREILHQKQMKPQMRAATWEPGMSILPIQTEGLRGVDGTEVAGTTAACLQR